MTTMFPQRVARLLAVLLCLGGCGSPSDLQKPGETTPKSKRVIGVSVLTMTNPFFKTIADTMSDEAAKHGYEVVAVSGDKDVARQRDQVKDFIASKVSAIVLMPCDSKAIGTAIQEANRAGIPVFTADIACLAPEAKVVAHIATDNHAGGRRAAEVLVEAIGGKGKVAILNHPGVESSIMRSSGFRERLAELKAAAKANVEVVADLPGLGDRDLGFKCTQDLLQSHADVAGIFAVNDPSALGAVAALENAGKSGQVKVIGFDGQPEARKAIRDGKLYATLIQFPDRIARQTVLAIVQHFEGRPPRAETLIDAQVYRRADAQKDPTVEQRRASGQAPNSDDAMPTPGELNVRRSGLFGDYGMLLVLLLLCMAFSWITYGEQHPTGVPAADELAGRVLREHPGARALIVTGATDEDQEFAATLQSRLAGGGVEVVDVARGQPADARQALERLAGAGRPIDLIAADHVAASWAVFDDLPRNFPALGSAVLVTPRSYHWPSFLNRGNLLNVASQIVVIAVLAIGMTMVIITGGIDLSVGSLIALSAVAAALLIRQFAGAEEATAAGIAVCCAAAVGLCALVGTFSGLMITSFAIPPFIATLAIMLVASGAAYILAGSQSIYQLPASFQWLGLHADLWVIPNAVVLMVLLYCGAHQVMKRTRFGRYVYAVGGNREAARLSGVPVNVVLVAVYAISGALAGLGGVIMASRLKSGSPTYGVMYELYVIAAVVVGGASLTGGEGRVFGTLIGALVIAVVNNGMNLTGVDSHAQKIVLGAVILGAVLLDILKKRGLSRMRSAWHAARGS